MGCGKWTKERGLGFLYLLCPASRFNCIRMIDPSFNDSFLLGSCLNKINTLKNGSYNERCTGKGLTLFPQVVLVENRSTTRRGMAVPIPRTFNSRLRERILATVWFEDAPPPPARRTPPGGSKPQLDLARKSPKPELVLPRKSPSSGCPPGCWPLLQLNLGPDGLSPRLGEGGYRHTWYLSFFLHWQNLWRVKFTPKMPIFRVKSVKKRHFFA